MRNCARGLLDGRIAAKIELYAGDRVCAKQRSAQKRICPSTQLHGCDRDNVDTTGSDQMAAGIHESPRPRRSIEALQAQVSRCDDGVTRLQLRTGTRPDARLEEVRAGSMLIASANRGMEWAGSQ